MDHALADAADAVSDGEANASALSAASETASKLERRIAGMIDKIEKRVEKVDTKLGDRLRILDADNDGYITSEELHAASAALLTPLSQEELDRLVAMVDDNHDGKIMIDALVNFLRTDMRQAQVIGVMEGIQKHREEVEAAVAAVNKAASGGDNKSGESSSPSS